MGICMTTSVREIQTNTNSNKQLWQIMKLAGTQNQSENDKSSNSAITVIDNKVPLETVSHQLVASNSDKSAFSEEKSTRVPIVIRRTISSLDIYDIPEIPIIFVLGGPGSGKLAHCRRLSKIDERIHHLSMLTPLLEVASIIGSRDPNIIPPQKALEVLMSIMSDIIPEASAIVITGYPRSMRDVVEYMARVHRVDGTIFLDWNDRSLERQIQLGSKNIEMDEDLARSELVYYRAHTAAMIKFFDHQGILRLITAGGRPGPDVFQEFHEEILGMLGHSVDDSSADRGTSARPKPLINGDMKRTTIYDIQRETSIESFNIFTEEDVSEPNSAANNGDLIAPVIVHKDVENILSIVTAGSIMNRVASGRINY